MIRTDCLYWEKWFKKELQHSTNSQLENHVLGYLNVILTDSSRTEHDKLALVDILNSVYLNERERRRNLLY